MASCKLTYQGKRYDTEELLEMDIQQTSEILKELNKDTLTTIEDIKSRSEQIRIEMKDGKETNYYTVKATGNPIKRITDRIGGFLSFFGSYKVPDISFGQHLADQLWQSDPHDQKKKTEKDQMETYDEYRDRMERLSLLGSIKGRILHYGLLKVANRAFNLGLDEKEINAKTIDVANEAGGDVNVQNYKWIEDKNVYQKIFRIAGINKLSTETPEILKDVACLPELSVWSQELGFGGTMDMFIAHADGTFSIIDWKTGLRFNTKITNELMKYGSQDIPITDNQRERAKLQIMMYAFILKMQYPNIKFRNLMAVWIPDEYFAQREDHLRNVEVPAYLEMIKNFFKDEKALKEAGINPKIYAKIIEKSPKIFDVYEYTNSSGDDILGTLVDSKFDPTVEYMKRVEEVNIILGRMKGLRIRQYTELPPEDKKRLAQLNEEINLLVADPGIQLNVMNEEDIGQWENWFGNYTDVNMGQFQTWVKQRNLAVNMYKEKHRVDMIKAEQLFRPIYDRYMKGKVKIRVGGIDRIANVNYAELYSFAYKTENIDGTFRERLIHDNDPEWTSGKLGTDEKVFLKFVNDKMESWFMGKDAYLTEHAATLGSAEKGNESPLNHLELFNLGRAEHDKMKWYKGWFAKVQETEEEVNYREGLKMLNRKPGQGDVYGANLLGRFSKEKIKQVVRDKFSWYNENLYGMNNDIKAAIPIKYLDNPIVLNNKEYTRNVLFMFDNFNKSMLHKQHMDNVYNLGQALKAYLEMKNDSNGQPLYENTISFLNKKLIGDIQNRIPKSKIASRPIYVGKYYDPVDKKYKGINLDLDKLGRLLIGWTSATTMWLKPFQGFGNFMHARSLTYREAAKGSIAQKFAHIDGNLIDITLEDILFADKVYSTEFLKDGLIGDINKNKMWLLAKKLDYIPDNYDYATNKRFILSTRNRSVNESALYLFHSMGEENVSLTTMVAQLHRLKNPVTGKSLWDSYEVRTDPKTGETDVFWKGGIRGYEQQGTGPTKNLVPIEGLTDHEIAKLKKVHERMQGGYRKEEAANIELYTVGKMMIQFKKFLPRLLMNAVGSKRYEVDLGYYRKIAETRIDPKTGKKLDVYEWTARMNEGRIRTMVGWALAWSKMGNGEYRWKNLSSEQKQNVIDFTLTMNTLFGMLMVYYTMFGDVPDDDPYKKWWWNYMVMNVSQQYNPVDLLDNVEKMARPVALSRAFKTSEALFAMTVATGNYMIGSDPDTYLTRAGDLKGWNAFVRSVPYLASWYDFSSKMKKGDITEEWWGDNWERRWR